MNKFDTSKLFPLFDPEGALYSFQDVLLQSLEIEDSKTEERFKLELQKRELKEQTLAFLDSLQSDVDYVAKKVFKEDEVGYSTLLSTAIASLRASTESGIYPLFVLNHFYLLGLMSQEIGIRTLTNWAQFTVPSYLEYSQVFANFILNTIKNYKDEEQN